MFLLMNGPADIGKDLAIEELIAKGYELEKLECKDRLHEMTMSFFNIEPRKYWPLYNNRDTKEVQQECYRVTIGAYEMLCNVTEITYRSAYGGYYYLSPREAMIYIAECVVKPSFGRDYFGVYRANKVLRRKNYFDASAGFFEELPPLIDKIGQDQIILIRVYSDNHSFDGDSRDYIPDGVIHNTHDVYNGGTLEEYLIKIESIVERYL